MSVNSTRAASLSDSRENLSRLSTALLSLAYPFLAHFAVAFESVPLTVIAIAVLAAIVLVPALLQGRAWAWVAIVPVALSCALLARSNLAVLPLYVPPVLVPAFMAWIFGRTLARGKTPLIARLIALMHTDDEVIEPAVFVYARRLTMAWTVLFASIATVNLTLAAIAAPDGLLLASGVTPPLTVSQQGWSIFANLMDPLLVAGFFVLEYAYRRLRFADQPYRNFFDFIRRASAAGPRLVQSMYRD